MKHLALVVLAALAANQVIAGSVSEVEDQLERYERLYYRAEGLLQKFDAELRSADRGFLQDSETYQQLLALRYMKHEAEHEVTDAYKSLVHSEHAGEAVAAIEKKLSSSPTVKLVALSDPISAMKRISQRPKFVYAGFAFKERKKDALAAVSFSSNEALLKAKREVEQELRERSRQAMADDALTAEIKENIPQSVMPEGRSPQAVKIKPGTGPEGNMNGAGFPKNTWALTFDDGPSGKYSLEVLKNLVKHKTPTTFFWLAQNVKRYPAIIEEMKAAGMSLQNHSFTHPNLKTLKDDPAALRREIGESSAVEAEIYGKKPLFFRCPYGSGVGTPSVRAMIARENMVHVGWNVDSLDWQDKDPESILARVKLGMEKEQGGVILFHDIHAQSVVASRLLLEYSDSLKGTDSQIRWVTIPRIVDEINGRQSQQTRRSQQQQQRPQTQPAPQTH